MVPLLIILGAVVGLFVAAFISKRRFGVLGLGLAAGAVISPIWSESASYVVPLIGVSIPSAIVDVIAASLLILIPAILFMFNGPSYKHIVWRVVGALLFTILAVALLVGPVGSILAFTGQVGDVYRLVVQYKDLIIGIGVALAVADFLIAKPTQKSDKKHR